VNEYRETFSNPFVATGRRLVDDIIDPAETRKYLAVLSNRCTPSGNCVLQRNMGLIRYKEEPLVVVNLTD